MRSECYRTERGLTPEQQRYNELWKVGKEIWRGDRHMPYVFLGFSPRPRADYHPGRRRPVMRCTPFDAATRFVPPHDVDVHFLFVRPEAPELARPGKAVKFCSGVFEAYNDETGQPRVDGNHIVRRFDLAINPRQEHPETEDLPVLGTLTYTGEPGDFVIRNNGCVVDLCVGYYPDTRIPAVVFRILVDDLPSIELTAERRVATGEVLATCLNKVKIGHALFADNGEPLVDRELKHAINVTRQAHLLRIHLGALEYMVDMTLAPPEQRPQQVPLVHTAPRIFVRLPIATATFLTSADGYRHTRYLRDCVREAIGPRGDYRLVAEHSGVAAGFVESRAQPHLKYLKIGEQLQVMPETAILVDGVEAGSTVSKGQPVADFCPRFAFSNWKDVEDILHATSEFLLDDFLRQQIVWEGTDAYIDKRFLPAEMFKASTPWVFDFSPCRPYLQENGYYALPLFPASPSLSFTANGMLYNYDTERRPTPAPVVKEDASRKRKRRRRSNRQPQQS